LGRILFLCLLLALAARAYAVPIAFFDRAAFDSAVAALAGVNVGTETFDSTSAGGLIADGGTLGGFTFNYPLLASFGVSLQVISGVPTTSPANFLGTDDGGVLQGGDLLEVFFSPLHAFGAYFILDAGLGPVANGDLTLSAGGTRAGLLASAQDTSFALGNNQEVYFLGLVDASTPFNGVTLEGSSGFFTYTLDDITSAAPINVLPEPASLVLIGSVLLGLAARVWAHRAGGARD
jgi:hypothetical protein